MIAPDDQPSSAAESEPQVGVVIVAGPFPLGQLVSTPGVLQRVHPEDAIQCLGRHCRCDWGDLCEDDRRENDRSLREGGRLFSAYADRNGVRFWIITECDRSATTLLLPEEY
jgi:hypothetical protein